MFLSSPKYYLVNQPCFIFTALAKNILYRIFYAMTLKRNLLHFFEIHVKELIGERIQINIYFYIGTLGRNLLHAKIWFFVDKVAPCLIIHLHTLTAWADTFSDVFFRHRNTSVFISRSSYTYRIKKIFIKNFISGR